MVVGGADTEWPKSTRKSKVWSRSDEPESFAQSAVAQLGRAFQSDLKLAGAVPQCWRSSPASQPSGFRHQFSSCFVSGSAVLLAVRKLSPCLLPVGFIAQFASLARTKGTESRSAVSPNFAPEICVRVQTAMSAPRELLERPQEVQHEAQHQASAAS